MLPYAVNENRHENAYYALERLENLKTDIEAAAGTMVAARAALAKHMGEGNTAKARDMYETLKNLREKLAGRISPARLHLAETGEDGLAAHAGKLAALLAAYNLMTKDYSMLLKAFSAFAAELPEHKTVSASVIGRLMNRVRMGYYPTDPENISHIIRAIAFPQDIVTNLFDPCCGEGKALKQIAVGHGCFTYGIELDEGRAGAAQDELHRVGFGSFFYSRVSREAFHLVFLNPPYLSVTAENGGRTRDEKKFLIESLPHLMKGGLLVYIVPCYRLTPDICRILADNLSDISVHRFTDAEFKKHNQVAVTGLRKERGNGTEEAAALFELACDASRIPDIGRIEDGRYPLPPREQKVAIFKGAVFNERELARQLKKSTGFEDMLCVKSSSGKTRRPPLPFSIGQLGLIGGSGLLNGLIECDTPHIIKGRIVKEVKSESEDFHNETGDLVSTEIRETVGNKMIFNILTPNGYRSLT
jgi:hypothetical protein